MPDHFFAPPLSEAILSFSEVHVGDILIADGGFTCLSEGQRVKIDSDKDRLFVRCAAGHHYLDGQAALNDLSKLVGFYLAPKLRKGFAAMDPERQRAISRMGGRALPADKRSFSVNPALAASAGRKGGMAKGGPK